RVEVALNDARAPDALAAAQADSLSLLGRNPLRAVRIKRQAAYLEGFSLHAGVHLHANDREGLAHLCGYGARPPLAQSRLSQLPDGRLAYRLKRPFAHGTAVLILEPSPIPGRSFSCASFGQTCPSVLAAAVAWCSPSSPRRRW